VRFSFFVDDYQTSIADLAGFRLPETGNSRYLEIFGNFYSLGMINFRGSVSGQFNNLFAQGNITTDLGAVTTGIGIQNNQKKENHTYKGDVYTSGFDIGSLLGQNEKIGKISMNAAVSGEGFDLETLELDLTGMIRSLGVLGYDYQDLDVAGTVSNRMFNGSLQVNDPNVSLDFLGMISFKEEVPVFDFRARLEEANLSALNIYQRTGEADAVLTINVNINATGSTLDDLDGNINVADIIYEDRYDNGQDAPYSTAYKTRQISIVNTNFAGHQKHLVIRSDFVDASLSGEIFYEDLLPAVKRFLALHLPSALNNKEGNTLLLSENAEDARNQNFQLKVLFKDTDLVSDLFLPMVRMSENSAIYVDFDSQRDIIDIRGSSDVLTLFGARFTYWNLIGAMAAGGYQITHQSASMMISDSIFVENFCLDGILYSDTLWYEINWKSWDGNNDPGKHGNIQGIAEFLGKGKSTIRFLPSYALINDFKWQIDAGNLIRVDTERIEVENLGFFSESQLIEFNGVLGRDARDRMLVHFHNFEFANLDAIVNVKDMNFGGTMNGGLSFAALYQQLVLEASLKVDQFMFNAIPLGDLVLQSAWDEPEEGFRMSAVLTDQERMEGVKPLLASGYFYPNRTDDHFNINILIDRLPLGIWGRYLAGILDDFRGFATGSLRLSGPLSDPGLSGSVFADNAGFGINYLNTQYSFSHRVEIGKNYFRFNNLVLRDRHNNTGLAGGTISHNGFRDFRVDVLVRPERMLALNTTSSHNALYYGRAFASGIVQVSGPEDDIVIDVSARTNRGTQIYLPLTYRGELSESNFITFVSPDTLVTEVSFASEKIAGLTLNFDLEVTPDAEVQLIFDSQIGDVIRGRGEGSLKLEINAEGAFNMFGEYVIQSGDYLFTLQNLINKRFRIEQGGVIRWNGDPDNADVDLRAAYRLRTSLYDLMVDVDTSDVYRRRVPVECVLILRDKLLNPAISFDIYLPGGDEGTRELIERRIATEQEMNRQVFSLLVLNRFLPASTDQYNTALGYGFGTTSSEFLSNQLSNWLSQISSEVDIGINYRPGDQISSQELEVALSTQLFNDRVLIDGNLGVAGSNPAWSQRTSNIVGDVTVEVKLTPEGKFRVKAFNRSNSFDILHVNAPYSQGLGVFYRKEFDSLSDLFRRSLNQPVIPEADDNELQGEL